MVQNNTATHDPTRERGNKLHNRASGKPHAMIFGEPGWIWWDDIKEAIIWCKWYNFKHWLKRDGKCITVIHWQGRAINVLKSNSNKRPKVQPNGYK